MQIFHQLVSGIYAEWEAGSLRSMGYAVESGVEGGGEAGYGQLSLVESYPVGGVLGGGGVDLHRGSVFVAIP